MMTINDDAIESEDSGDVQKLLSQTELKLVTGHIEFLVRTGSVRPNIT